MIGTLIQQQISNQVLITGGIVPHGLPQQLQKSEARLIYEKISNQDHWETKFLLEEKSLNTLENVTEGLRTLDFSNYKKICFIFPAHGITRAYLTLRKFLPYTQLLPCPYNAWYPEEKAPVTADNWHKTHPGTQRIWGEYLRIKQYGERGDIAYDEVSSLIQEIDMLILADRAN